MSSSSLRFVAFFLIALAASAWGQTRPIRVGLIAEGCDSDLSVGSLPAQLNDDTWYNFNASYVSINTLTSVGSIVSNYDVLYIGCDGYGTGKLPSTNLNNVYSFVQAGGGLVTSGWLVYETYSESVRAALQPMVPVTLSSSGSYTWCQTTGININNPTHPIANGIPSNLTHGNTFSEASSIGIQSWGNSIASLPTGCLLGSSSNQAIVAGSVGNGRAAYTGYVLCGGSSYGTPNLRSGAVDHLIENIFAWAANLGNSDTCSQFTTCAACSNGGNNTCEWCLDSNSCVGTNAMYCQNYINDAKFCPMGCSSFKDCHQCTRESILNCSWSIDSGVCFSPTVAPSPYRNVINNGTYCYLDPNNQPFVF